MDNERINRGNTRLEKFRKIRHVKRIAFACSILLSVLLFTLIVSLLTVTQQSVIAVSPAWNGTVANSFAGGSGTEADPYLITTAEQLAYLSQQVNAGTTYTGQHIQLMQDILLNKMNPNGTFVSGSPRKFTRIGSDANKFAGNFDGDGYEIIGLYINNEGNGDYQGLFGYADTGSVIRNIKISGSVKGGNRSGAVAGFSNGLITACEIHVTILTNWRNYQGGVAGEAGANSIISNCHVSGSVVGTQFVGGIVGYTSGVITGSDANNTVSGQEYVGGLTGWAFGTGSGIRNSSFSGTATANANYIGGIAGRADGIIAESTVDATITGRGSFVGGIVGWANGTGSEISSNSFSGSVTGHGNYVGGIAGQADGVITQSTVDAVITGESGYVGGIAGKAGTGSTISNASVSGNVSGKSGKIGGITGYTDGTVKITINTATVQSYSGNTGGIAGEAGGNATVSNSYNSGKIQNNGGSYYGGIVGYVDSGTEIHHNLNMGQVGGTWNVGSVTGNAPNVNNAWSNYYNDYEGAPIGTNGGDIINSDGAVPIGAMSWEKIQELLNTNNDDGDDIWNQDVDDDGVIKPGSGTGSTPTPTPTVMTSTIKEGKFYTVDSLAGGIAVDVTSDSVFTVYYTLEYAATCEPKDHTLSFIDNNVAATLPVGTSITMLDEGSYYYINLAAPVTVIILGDFIKMGSDDLHYNPAPVVAGDTMEYLFILDFTNVSVENQLPANLYHIKLDTPDVGYTGGLPAATITGRNQYELSISDDVNSFTVSLGQTTVGGYDYKTDGKVLVYAFYLEKTADHVRIALPIGTKINGNSVSSALPYAFVPVDLGNTSTVTLDMSGSVDPIPSGDYTLNVIAYSCTDMTKPQNGYRLDGGTTDISIVSPVGYAIRATALTRLFDRSSNPISVAFNIETQGSNVVKSTLQKKYGNAYVNIDGQINLPIAIAGESAILSLPAGSPKGTYRFQLTLYDYNGVEKAKDVENVIIK